MEKIRSKGWVGNIYHKFEAMCQEVDGLVAKDTVKYVENQVQTVGQSMKKLYSGVVQDFLIPTDNSVKREAQTVNGEQNYAVDTDTSSLTGATQNLVDTQSSLYQDVDNSLKSHNPSTSTELDGLVASEVVENEFFVGTRWPDILGCMVDSLPTRYLGLPLGARSKSKDIWHGVLDKCERKLSKWKSRYLSMGGRLTLINSVLDSMPTYMMSLFPMPKSVEHKLDKLRRDFLWHGKKEKRGYNLVKWESLVYSKKQGGLGIKNLEIQNKCLLQKWLWRYNTEQESMWRRFIEHKYDSLNHWITREVTAPYGCSMWKTIRKLWPSFRANTLISIGDGCKTFFWEDTWQGQQSLKVMFHDFYQLSNQKQATVSEVWSFQGWNLNFRRHLNDWEMNTLAQLLQHISNFSGPTDRRDRLMWKWSNKGYTVKGNYYKQNLNQEVIQWWPWKLIWKVKTPFKVACFVWLLVKKSCLTHEVLQRRGLQICSRCFLCNQEGESNEHLFLHCKVTSNLWNMFSCKAGISWTMPRTTLDCLISWKECVRTDGHLQGRLIVPACIWWTIWKERNSRCFEDKRSSLHCLQTTCLSLFYFWHKETLLYDRGELLEALDSVV